MTEPATLPVNAPADLPAVIAAATASLAEERVTDREIVLARVQRQWPTLLRGLRRTYGEQAGVVAGRAVALAIDAFLARSEALRGRDLKSMVAPDWFQDPGALGYACYTERFAGNLAGVGQHVDYLVDLGVTYLHLMPLLQPRPAPNDGGYAVMDYREVRADLGTMDDLRALAATLHEHDIALTLDLVLNHVAREHEWAVRARAGEERYRGYFHLFADRTMPDAYERTMPEVFPDFAPGSYTWDDDIGGWVWTTFNTWQWDLNWHNPEVLLELADVILYLANCGVDCVRLDAIAFLWKRLGTTCQNQPEVHALTEVLHAISRIAAPSLIFKAEAIVSREDLVPYLGVGEYAGKVSDLAYHNNLMVQVWSCLATGDARLTSVALQRFGPKPPSTAWGTYVRCHDDIGWAIDDSDAAAIGWNGHAHRVFLSDWYSGFHPGSDARGLVFQHNLMTNDRRISGTAASLCGMEAALEAGDAIHLQIATSRLWLAHAIMLGFGGMPLLYMGDELALRNDYSFAQEPEHAADNRWVHRPAMPWAVAARRHEEGTLENRVWQSLRHLIRMRSSLPAMHASIESEVWDATNPGVLAWRRAHATQPVFVLNNVTSRHQPWPRWLVPLSGALVDAISGTVLEADRSEVWLQPYQALWLVEQTSLP